MQTSPCRTQRYYNRGTHTLDISMSLHQVNRERLCARLQQTEGIMKGSAILLQGGSTSHFSRYDTDTEHVSFRQESYFHWTFGVLEPGCYGAVNVDTAEAYIFVPKPPKNHNICMDKMYSLDHFKDKYRVCAAHYIDELESVLKTMAPSQLLTLSGVNEYNKTKHLLEASFDGIAQFNVNNKTLSGIMTECRIYKNEIEIEAIRHANSRSTQGLLQIMKRVKPGMYEYQLEGMFKHYAYANGGMKHWSFNYICASGSNGAIIWYGSSQVPRDDELIKDGDLCLLDLGGEYYCYAADVTFTFPANGKFTPDQRLVYNSVLRTNRKVIDSIKPGVCWIDMHLLAWRTLLEGLRCGGIIQGDIEDMMRVRLGAVFMPHGVGHLVGLDILDVGGRPNGESKIEEAIGDVNFMTDRIMEPGVVITVEPGCYFVDYVLDKALNNPDQNCFIVQNVLERFRGFGGARVEDTVLVTDTGAVILGSQDAPRTVEEIESCMAERLADRPIPILAHGTGLEDSFKF